MHQTLGIGIMRILPYLDLILTVQQLIPLVKFGLYICYEGPAFQKLKAGKNEMALPSRYVVNANNAIQILIGEISIGHCIYTIAVYRRRRKRRHAQSDIDSKQERTI